MCGICGHFGVCCAVPDPASVVARLAHRGPDGSSVHTPTPTSFLGFTRLSLVGSARQPFVSERGNLSLVVNGEVYNADALRLALGPRAPPRLPDTSDCSVLLPCIEAWGVEETLARVEGMFALALVRVADDGGCDVYLARDRMGIKPLVWGQCGGVLDSRTVSGGVDSSSDGGGGGGGGSCCLAFASEAGALPAGWELKDVMPGTVLHVRVAPAQQRAGSAVTATTSATATVFAPPWVPSPQADPVTLGTIRTTLVAAVSSHLQGDHSVGVLLSGGLDSAILAAVAARLMRQRGGPRLRAFTITHRTVAAPPADGPPSDVVFASRTAAAVGAELSVATFDTREALSALPQVISALESYDVGLVRVAVPQLLLARHVARAGCRVVLSGEGADEVFAGYALFRAYDGRSADGPTGLDAFRRELERRLACLWASELLRVDRCTSASGVEARVPYLDPAFLAVAMHPSTAARKLSHPSHGSLEKALLRDAFASWLPDDVLYRRKVGMADGVGEAWVRELQAAAVASEGVEDPARAEAALYKRIFAEVAPGAGRAALARSRIAFRNAGRLTPASGLPDASALLRNFRCVRDDPQVGAMFTAADAAAFCTRELGVDVPLAGATPTIALLNSLIEAVLQRVPFHNFSLLTRPRVPPVPAEVRADWLAVSGGTCASTSAAFAAMLSALGFDVSLVAAVVRTEFDHLALLVRLCGRAHYVDIGNGKRYAEAAPLVDDADGCAPLGSPTTLQWRVRWCPVASRFHLLHGRAGVDASGSASWDVPPSVTFDPDATVHYAFFYEHFARARRSDAFVFLRSLRLAVFPALTTGLSVRDAVVNVHGVRVPTAGEAELLELVRPHVSSSVHGWLLEALAALRARGIDLWATNGEAAEGQL
jgi:asparagine synthase (glutamine-hydrolysing)